MARKDEILKSFLEHEIIKDKYQVKPSHIPSSIREAIKSDIPIIKAIALIIENLESPQVVSEKSLRDIILQHLNQTAI